MKLTFYFLFQPFQDQYTRDIPISGFLVILIVSISYNCDDMNECNENMILDNHSDDIASNSHL